MKEVKCAECNNEFDWAETYYQENTPGAEEKLPYGFGDFWPRTFCPVCGCLLAEFETKKNGDEGWLWYGKNAKVNSNRELPPSPLSFLANFIPRHKSLGFYEDQININSLK